MISSHDTYEPVRHDGTACNEIPEWLPVAAGAALAFVALSRKRSLLGLGVMAGAGYLLYKAAANGSLQLPPEVLDRLKSQFGTLASTMPGNASLACANERIDEASRESFPASDPPATY